MELTTLRQRWGTQPTCDLEGALNQALARWDATDLDGKTVAIGVGSRGIHNYAAIIRGVGERFRSRGAAPFFLFSPSNIDPAPPCSPPEPESDGGSRRGSG